MWFDTCSGPATVFVGILTYRGRPPAGRNAVGLSDAVDEIVDSVLDAADLDILEEIGDQRSDGLRLLRLLMIDILRRYRARQQRFEELRQKGERR